MCSFVKWNFHHQYIKLREVNDICHATVFICSHCKCSAHFCATEKSTRRNALRKRFLKAFSFRTEHIHTLKMHKMSWRIVAMAVRMTRRKVQHYNFYFAFILHHWDARHQWLFRFAQSWEMRKKAISKSLVSYMELGTKLVWYLVF